MNVKRVLTALIGLPIVLVIVLFGNKYMMDILLAIIACIAMYEYLKCVSANNDVKPIKWISYLLAASIALIHVIPEQVLQKGSIILFPTILFILFLHTIVTNMKITFKDIVYSLFGIVYIVGLIVFLPLTYGMEGKITGKMIMFFILMSSWGSDVAAYTIGVHFGKHRFSKVSPKKTTEGCISGLIAAIVFCIVTAIVMNRLYNTEISYLFIGIVGGILGIIGQIGDFAASVIKRSFDIKDFSEIFPGHGGMIDRIDSVMFIAPFAYFIFNYFV